MPTSVNSTATASGAYFASNKCAKNRAACHNAKLPSGTNTSGGSAVPAHLLMRDCLTTVKQMHGERKAINQWQKFEGFCEADNQISLPATKGETVWHNLDIR
jgi:hypothetical protein